METAYYPEDLEEALDILKAREPRIIAGGTDLLLEGGQHNNVMFIGMIPELKKIERSGGCLKIGAGVSFAELLKSDETKFLREVVESIASPGIRNWATVGGNICNASPIGDLLPVIYAMDGRVIVAKKGGRRRAAIESFIVDRKRVDLKADELVEGIELSILHGSYGKVWFKAAGREANALSKISVFSLFGFKGRGLEEFRLAIGGASSRVIRERNLERDIIEAFNSRGGARALKDVFKRYLEILHPIDDQRSGSRYKLRVAENIFGEITDELIRYSQKQ